MVWQVLQALRAHDDRFDATINTLELNKNKGAESILVGYVTDREQGDEASEVALQLAPVVSWALAMSATSLAQSSQ